MIEQERKVMLNLADTLKGKINRICVTKDISELDKMFLYAIVNLTEIRKKKYGDLIAERVAERVENGKTVHT